MATLAERILERLAQAPTPLDDDELADELGVRRQAVNQACRRLERGGRVVRATGSAGKIVNRLAGTGAPEPQTPARPAPARSGEGLLAEDEVKAAVAEFLEERGYEVVVRWGRERGVDIEAVSDGHRWVIEAKGEVALQPQQVNYFLGALGELVQRMADPDASYGLALPDNRQYRGMVARLPELARRRLGLHVFFVQRAGEELQVDLDDPNPG